MNFEELSTEILWTLVQNGFRSINTEYSLKRYFPENQYVIEHIEDMINALIELRKRLKRID